MSECFSADILDDKCWILYFSQRESNATSTTTYDSSEIGGRAVEVLNGTAKVLEGYEAGVGVDSEEKVHVVRSGISEHDLFALSRLELVWQHLISN